MTEQLPPPPSRGDLPPPPPPRVSHGPSPMVRAAVAWQTRDQITCGPWRTTAGFLGGIAAVGCIAAGLNLAAWWAFSDYASSDLEASSRLALLQSHWLDLDDLRKLALAVIQLGSVVMFALVVVRTRRTTPEALKRWHERPTSSIAWCWVVGTITALAVWVVSLGLVDDESALVDASHESVRQYYLAGVVGLTIYAMACAFGAVHVILVGRALERRPAWSRPSGQGDDGFVFQ